MKTTTSPEYKVGDRVEATVGRGPKVGTVVEVEAAVWGRGMRPAGVAPGTPFTILSVDFGGQIGVRGFSSDLVRAV